jgi:hypothetical protein
LPRSTCATSWRRSARWSPSSASKVAHDPADRGELGRKVGSCRLEGGDAPLVVVEPRGDLGIVVDAERRLGEGELGMELIDERVVGRPDVPQGARQGVVGPADARLEGDAAICLVLPLDAVEESLGDRAEREDAGRRRRHGEEHASG